MGVILDIKYGVDGELEKYKCRNCIKGHPGNVTKGVHYTETFSAAPDMISSRMIGVIAMKKKMKRIAWDVNTAYLNSECAAPEAGRHGGHDRHDEGHGCCSDRHAQDAEPNARRPLRPDQGTRGAPRPSPPG